MIIFSDDDFLLRFLRCYEYSYLKTINAFEIWLKEFKSYPEYFSNLDIRDAKLSELLDTGFFIFLPERNADGSLNFLLRSSRLDPDKFTSSEIIRFFTMLVELEREQEETQLCGIKFFADLSNTPMKFFSLFSIRDFKNMAYILNSLMTMRLHEMYLFNIPFGAASVVQFLFNLFSDKMRKLTHFLNNKDDLKKYLDLSLLPEEDGGKKSTAEIVADIRKRLEDDRGRFISMDTEFDILLDKNSSNFDQSDNDSGIVGSFRKLEVD
jgi:hypothetical protein